MNPWVVHFREEVFGARPREFIPERWLQMKGEADEEYAGRMKAMKDADLSFGNGNRVCLGRPLALIELAKVTATLFGKYEVCSVLAF
jgi:cytochrome P450